MNPTLIPSAPEAERAVIAAVLSTGGRALLKLDFLRAEDFQAPEYQAVYEAALGIWAEGGQPDYVTVTETMSSSYPGAKELVHGFRENVGDPERVDEYGRIVVGKGLGRALVLLGERTASRACSGDPVEVLDEMEQSILRLRPDRGDGFQRLSLLSPAKVPAIPRELPTGFRGLDVYLGGLGQGRLITIAARPAVGKTTLAMNIAAHAASRGHKVGFYSLEMSVNELMERVILAEANVDSHRVRQKELTTEDVANLGSALIRISSWELAIDDTPGMSTFELSTRAKREKAERGLDLLVIDYIGLITPPTTTDSRVEQVSIITRQLKVLSRSLNIPIIAVSQLNRQVENREGGEPRLSDLRDSGSVEQDSDQVVFLWTTAPTSAASPFTVTQCKVSKNRSGPTGEFTLALRKEQSKFVQT